MNLPSIAWAGSRFRTPPLGFGASPLGPLGDGERERESLDLVPQAYAAGLRYFDVAPFYGLGLAELRLGAGLRHLPRDEIVVSTKVGRLLAPERLRPDADRIPFRAWFDYSAEATFRSLDDSLARLGLSHLDLVLVHDLSERWHGADLTARLGEAARGAFRALHRLREDGIIRAFGIGTNDPLAAARALEIADVDVVMLAGAPTLLNHRAAAPLLDLCARRKVGIIAAAPFNSGILATGVRAGARYFYAEPSADIVVRTRRIEDLCEAFGVPLGAAALHYPLRHDTVEMVLPGFRTAAELNQGTAWMEQTIPAAFWDALAGLEATT